MEIGSVGDECHKLNRLIFVVLGILFRLVVEKLLSEGSIYLVFVL